MLQARPARPVMIYQRRPLAPNMFTRPRDYQHDLPSVRNDGISVPNLFRSERANDLASELDPFFEVIVDRFDDQSFLLNSSSSATQPKLPVRT